MMTLVGVFLLTMLLITGVAMVRERNLFVVAMLSGVFSLLMASNFFILDAADVALTEAAVGAGISTVLFLGALALTVEREEPLPPRRRTLAAIVLAAMTGMLLLATIDQPRLGDPMAPVHQHVAPWYIEQTPLLIDVPNIVTAILASFRGYDTLGEVFVVLTAGIGVLFILSAGRKSLLPDVSDAAASDERAGLRHHLIPIVIGKLVIPFIILFGLYVQFHGDFGPGGGFQAGALVAAGIILYALLKGERQALTVIPPRALIMMAAGGAVLYGAVGIAGILRGGTFLDYSVLATDPVAGQHLGILLIELGVGITVSGVLLLIFHSFAARRSHP